MFHSLPSRLSLLSWLLLAGGLLFTGLAAWQLQQASETQAANRFAAVADQLSLKVEERLFAYALVGRGGVALHEASETITADEWRRFTENMHDNTALKGMQELGFARFVRESERRAHLDELRRNRLPEHRIHPPGKRDAYGYVLHLETYAQRTPHQPGFDLLSDAEHRRALLQARDSGRPVLLDHQHAEDSGYIMLLQPVYAPDHAANSRASRLQGWVFTGFNMPELIGGLLENRQFNNAQWLGLRVYSGNTMTPSRLLFQQGSPGRAAGPFVERRFVNFNGHQWLLVFEHLEPALAVGYTRSLAILAAGLTLTLLLLLLLRSAMTTRTRALALAEQLTDEIRQRESQVEKLLSRLQNIAARVPGVVFEYRFGTDGRSSFPYASEGIRQIYGISPEQAAESATAFFDAIHPDDMEAVTDSMRLSSRELTPWRHEFRVRGPNDRPRWLLGDALPRREADGATSWCGVLTDITVSKQTELALQAASNQARHFREALDHVPSFIYMKDTRFRYTYANRAALELFGCNASTLQGSLDEQFFPEDTALRLRESDQRVLGGELSTEEVEIIGKDGHSTVFLDIKAPIFDDPEQRDVVGLLGIRTDITPLKNSEQQLRQLAHFDPLTKLHNRLMLSDRLQQAMSQARRHGQSLAVVYLDLDGFKHINDSHGHATGDKVLATAARRMKDAVREGDTLARVGGDEFVAILLDLPGEECAPLLDRLLEATARPVTVGNLRLGVTASLGVTFYPQAEELAPDQLLRQADQAMYQAKLAGKNRYYLFDTEQDRDMRSHHESLERIRTALQRGEFVLHYQPKVNLRTGEVLGAEALIRWQHPDKGLLPPSHFLPAIEDHALSVDLGNWVIDSALQQLREWRGTGLDFPVSVNVGARQLRQPDFADQLRRLLGHYPDIDPAMLELEVLETSALGDLAQIAERLSDCRALGVGLSLDDFGTGYSSLTYLKRLPASTVKVDQSFVRDILEDPEDLTILDGVLSLADAFDLQVLAEGVETKTHGDMLLRIGCELAQGYGIARPMPAADLAGWLQQWQPEPHWATLPKVERARLPLLYAGIEHAAWLESIRTTLHHPGRGWPELNAQQCRFGLWYRGCGTEEQERLTSLAKLHRQLHGLAAELRQLHAGGKQQQALFRFNELQELHRQWMAELEHQLQTHAGDNITPLRRTLKSV